MDAIEKRALAHFAELLKVGGCEGELRIGRAFGEALVAEIAALTPPEGSDQSLLELAAMFETCIPFLPSAGQRNIGKAVAQLRHMAMGYVLVPVEPTEQMLDSCGAGAHGLKRQVWAAMLTARPEVP